ncbi:MAG: MerR family transcriptional regulator [Oscillospiraceae bacterium]|jgi:DNA-binding transcriptional MerR regulator|nr:MerR family transcriptional regulator [Oscillospiraceae bacterium]
MNELIKISEMSSRYDISARTLRYYEEMGLLSSTRSDDYAYRMYDDEALKRIEQILILRKLNISIKDIKRIFDAAGSEVVLEVLGKKVDNIDDEVALLNELKSIVLDFIEQIKAADFGSGDDVKRLYEKASEIETRLVNVDYDGNTADTNRLAEVTGKLAKIHQTQNIRIYNFPSCKMVSSSDFSFAEENNSGMRFLEWFKSLPLSSPYPQDFLGLGSKENTMCWIRLYSEGMCVPDEFKIIDFAGGLYAVVCDIDEQTPNETWEIRNAWLEAHDFERDLSRPELGNIIASPQDTKLGYSQMDYWYPIKQRK